MEVQDLLKYEAETAQPKPKATINSYRSFGYSLHTAISDIIDNSITAKAKNIWITFQWEGKDSIIIIKDDGEGMNSEELVDAMTPGSKDPEDERSKSDLGRFGMGLKTASFSQCKRLTVITKKAGYSVVKRCWDLDYVNERKEWKLLDFITRHELLEECNKQKSGTLVVWEVLDRLVGNAHKDSSAVRTVFLQEFFELERHLGMIFHRFLDRNGLHKLKIFINGSQIEPWDPFLTKNSSRQACDEYFMDNCVRIRAFVLPHLSVFKNEEELAVAGGPLGWYEQQGFYIYRNDRLLVAGDWLGMYARNDHSKLARIAIDFSNSIDHLWSLDIKKSTAKPPTHLRKDIERIGKACRKQSGIVYSHRGSTIKHNPDLPDVAFKRVWEAFEKRDGTIEYHISEKHPVIKQLLASDVISKKDVKGIIRIIQDSIPVETIIYYQNEDPGYHERQSLEKEVSESVVELARDVLKSLMSQGIEYNLALKQLFHIEPFNRYPQLTAYLND